MAEDKASGMKSKNVGVWCFKVRFRAASVGPVVSALVRLFARGAVTAVRLAACTFCWPKEKSGVVKNCGCCWMFVAWCRGGERGCGIAESATSS